MTNYLKKIMLSAALGLALVTPVLAQDKECQTPEQVHSQMSEGVKVRDLTAAEQARLIDKKGPPPNTKGGELKMELMETETAAAVNVYEDGCYLTHLGPARKGSVYEVLGITEAERL